MITNLKRLTGLSLFIMSMMIVFSSCDEEETTVTDNNGNGSSSELTITVTSPADAVSNGISVEQGSSVEMKVALKADEGLSTVKTGETVIKTFTGTEKSDTVSYLYLAKDKGEQTVTITVEDAKSNTKDVVVKITVTEGVDLGTLIMDFAGQKTAAVVEMINDLPREVISFAVTGDVASVAKVEAVESQVTFNFNVDNPDSSDPVKVFQMLKQVSNDTTGGWTGGWNHIIFNTVDATFDETLVKALPKLNADRETQTNGTKVIQMDVYYDDTQDDTYKFDSLTTLRDSETEIWNADPKEGYAIDLFLIDYLEQRVNHDGAGMYMGYKGYITKANEWVTVTFDAIDFGRTASFYVEGDENNESPTPAEVNGVKLIVGGGYEDGGSGDPIYFKNLRIVDAQ